MMFASFLTLILATGAPMEASGPEAQVADLVQADLPIDLAVVSVAIMGEASWSEAAQLQVSGPGPPALAPSWSRSP
jgi:hypothetical protein